MLTEGVVRDSECEMPIISLLSQLIAPFQDDLIPRLQKWCHMGIHGASFVNHSWRCGVDKYL